MLVSQSSEFYICAHSLRRQIQLGRIDEFPKRFTASFHLSARLPQNDRSTEAHRKGKAASLRDDQNSGAMSRRLSEMTEENIEHGGRSARRAVDEAGFSEELRRQLEAKIADSNFRNENPAAFAQLNMPVFAP